MKKLFIIFSVMVMMGTGLAGYTVTETRAAEDKKSLEGILQGIRNS